MTNKSQICDMHVHSDCSDGSDSPEQLITIAQDAQVKAVALCDHNTISGLKRFEEAARQTEIIAVPGVEITAAYHGKEVHILGLFLKTETYDKLTSYLEQTNMRKEESNRALAKRLNEGGFEIDYDTVKRNAGTALPNRVHFANELIEKGYITSVDEAFAYILSEDGDFYKPTEKLDALEVISFLKSIDAVPVMAHPLVNLSCEELCDFLPQAKQYGLVAIETIYTLFNEEESVLAVKLAERYGLLQSGGSDFHGNNKPDVKMGRGKDNILVPFEIYERLRPNA